MQATLSVIIPTMACAGRAAQLRRAIGSVRASGAGPVRIIVVVNGTRSDAALCDWLRAQADVHYAYVATPSAPGAVLHGRRQVETAYFSTLDDDDEYLPGASGQKMALLDAERGADLLVTNAYLCCDGSDSLCHAQLAEVAADPLACLMRFNWLSSGNALYRTAAVGISYFEDYHPYAEWTWLAYRLAMDGKRVAVLDWPSCRHHNTAQSLSKSAAYAQSYLPLFQRMLACAPPAPVARMIERKVAAAHHEAAFAALLAGHRLDAWRHHWRSLGARGGLQYLSATRHLFK